MGPGVCDQRGHDVGSDWSTADALRCAGVGYNIDAGRGRS